MGYASNKNKDARLTKRDTREGRAGIETLGFAHGGLYSEEIIEIPGGQTITGATGTENAVIPAKHIVRRFGPLFGNSMSSISDAAFAALADSAGKAGVINLNDEVAPIGSTCQAIEFTLATGAITGSKMYLKTAANTWTSLT